MKRGLICLFAFAICFTLAQRAYASQATQIYVYDMDEHVVEVTFNENSNFNIEQQQWIADILVNDTLPIQSRAWCWLTGHNYISDAVTVTTHEARVLSPRCLEETYEVTTCSKCNYYAEDLLGAEYIFCCPEE